MDLATLKTNIDKASDLVQEQKDLNKQLEKLYVYNKVYVDNEEVDEELRIYSEERPNVQIQLNNVIIDVLIRETEKRIDDIDKQLQQIFK